MVDKDKALISTEESEQQGIPINELQRLMTLEPNVVLEQASRAARELKGIVERKPRKVIINNEQYLEYEDWQTVAQFFSTTVITRDAIPVEIDGVKGARAEADAIHLPTGRKVSGATAYCMRDEDNWKDKPWFQLASMAQTRAGAKALRNRFSWVVVLAGYRPTPAEELPSWTIDDRKETAKGTKVAPPAKSAKPPETTTAPEAKAEAPKPATYKELGYSSVAESNKLRQDFYNVATKTMKDDEILAYLKDLGYESTKVIPKEKVLEYTKQLTDLPLFEDKKGGKEPPI